MDNLFFGMLILCSNSIFKRGSKKKLLVVKTDRFAKLRNYE